VTPSGLDLLSVGERAGTRAAAINDRPAATPKSKVKPASPPIGSGEPADSRLPARIGVAI
jgi:hypothetical protein